MARLPHALLLLLLVSTIPTISVYADETADAPVAVTTDNSSTPVTGLILPSINITDGIADGRGAAAFADPFTVSPRRFKRPDPSYRALQAAFVASIAIDLGSTWNLPKNMTEGNPLLGKNKAQQISVSSAFALFTLWQSRSQYARGNTKMAKYLLWAGTAAHTFCGAYNIRNSVK
ncbi:MAG: hypothetical protein LBP68_01880 [Acidobacteriota bacterium]|jgi:hypothetical protein|nr:hypothetical protein [Acidobacteriota bacterium]